MRRYSTNNSERPARPTALSSLTLLGAAPRGLLPLAVLAVGSLWLAGCGGAPAAQFRTNEAWMLAKEREFAPLEPAERDDVKRNVKEVLVALFGTPDEPRFPAVDGEEPPVDAIKLEMAAGAVNSDIFGKPRGLYREHCAHCHGISGDGQGPTAAFLNPYPRDYRSGLFKFKSTPIDLPPTHEDLHRILVNGIPGTAMPSFRLLADDEIEALIHYVRYLSIRGQVEQVLLVDAVDRRDMLIDAASTSDIQDRWAAVEGLVSDTISKWTAAEAMATPVSPPPANFESSDSIARGRELFFSETAKCAGCHGRTALGDGETNDFDDWTKAVVPNDEAVRAELIALGAVLPPRNIRPRNLRSNVFRGGRRPIDLYWRIHNGIKGTPMPAAAMRPADAGPEDPRMTSDDLWHLIAYVRNLPFEDLSSPVKVQTFQRERQ
jgi:mono/diheme cytochrome c family protein